MMMVVGRYVCTAAAAGLMINNNGAAACCRSYCVRAFGPARVRSCFCFFCVRAATLHDCWLAGRPGFLFLLFRVGSPIPPELWTLACLRRVDVSRNSLTGQIPRGVGRVSRLEHLSCSFNRLSGPVPAELGLLAGLKQLHLGACVRACVRACVLFWLVFVSTPPLSFSVSFG